MEAMFDGCKSLTSLDLSHFNTSRVTDMESMFNGCKILETIYASRRWSTVAVTESDNMFCDCTNLVGGQGTVYDKNHIDAAYAQIDGGQSNPGYFTGKAVVLNGDVNNDGEVNIADVNCIINVILGGQDIYEGRADVNGDGEVNIADINATISLLL
jgi:surface protein